MKYVFNLSNTRSQSASNTHAGQFGGLREGTRSANGRRPTVRRIKQVRLLSAASGGCRDANAERSFHRKTIYTFL